jgi:hypothetical protein
MKNLDLQNTFKFFRNNSQVFDIIQSEDKTPDQFSIIESDKINTKLLGLYLAHNIKQNIVGFDMTPIYGKLSNIDTKYILMSIFLFSNLPENNLKIITEIGGGYGNMLRLNYSIQKYNLWNIIDFTHMNLLQEYYLSSQNIPREKYVLTSNNDLTKINNQTIDVIISIYSLSNYTIHDFIIYYMKFIINAKYFFYVFNKFTPSIEICDVKLNMISNNFNLVKKIETTDNLNSYCLFINKNILY